MELNPTAGWKQVGDQFYRRTQLYSAVFDLDLDLDNYHVVGAPCGGALALYRDETKLQEYKAGRPSKPGVEIYSCAGKPIRSIAWDQGKIRGAGWSEDEKLVVVAEDGVVRCYYGLQDDFTQFSLGNNSEQYGVRSCRFYDTGFVALLGNNTLLWVASYDEPRPKTLSSPPSTKGAGEGPIHGVVHSWALIPPSHTLSRSVEVLLSIGPTVYVADATECEDRFLDIGPFSHMAVSPNGRHVALYTTSGMVHVVTSDFQMRLSEHDLNSKIPPKSLAWCGNDAVVIAWEDEIHVVGPGAAVATFFYDSRIHVVQDIDGVRVVGNESCDFLQKVPDVTREVFQLGTESAASILLDAVEQLEMQSPKADDNIQLIRANLTEAVDTCVNAAGHEFNVHWQKRLLKAASFGKSVLDMYNSDDFVDMCETLRVLNAVRFYEIGLPLSFEQYQRLSPERLVGRLLDRHEYRLAHRVAGYLHLPSDRIYVHWACAKVRLGAGDDDAISRLVVERLAGRPGISFEAVAQAAHDEGRARLATELLNHEPRAGRQVPLLLSMGEDEMALDKAVESGDTDLVLGVLHALRRRLPLPAFFRAVSRRPVASALVEAAAAREGDAALLKDLYYQDDRRLDGAGVFLREALRQPDARTSADKMALAARLLTDNARESAFELRAMKEAAALLRLQEALDRDLADSDDSFAGLSVGETMFKLIRLGYHGRAKKIQSEFKVPERMAWWIRLRALVAKRDWNEIEDIAKAKKSPIGWEPFFNMVLQAGNPRLAATFIPKCTNLKDGVTGIIMYEKCGMPIKAAEEAVRLKNHQEWKRLLEATGRNTPDGREIERLGQVVFKK